VRDIVEAGYDEIAERYLDWSIALVESKGFEILRRERVRPVERGVEGGFLWVLARSS
jgi:hypothetical protein